MKYMGIGIIVNLIWVTFIDNESINLIVFLIVHSSVRPFYFIIDRGGGGFRFWVVSILQQLALSTETAMLP